MVVQVRLFAMLREQAGTERVELTLDEGATAEDARLAVGRENDLADLFDRLPVVMAVNREYAGGEQVLREGDELALIPPVCGGDLPVRPAPGITASTDGRIDTTPAEGGIERFRELISRGAPAPPYSELLGTRPLDAEPGHVRLEFQARDEFVNPGGAIQGGFLTAMLDEAMGPAALSALEPGHMVPTIELKVSFLRPGRPGRMIADARVVHRGSSVVFLESSLVDGEGTLIARASATARIVPFKRREA